MENISEEHQLHIKQMKEWFNEHKMIQGQLERTIHYYLALAQSNQKQLELHMARLELAVADYNELIREHGWPSDLEVTLDPPYNPFFEGSR